MNDDESGDVWFAILAAIVVIVLVLGFACAGLIFDRPASQYSEETRRLTYDQSRQYEQGSQLDLARYCAQYEQASGAGKSAVAGLIRDTRATYAGPVTENVERCLGEVGAN